MNYSTSLHFFFTEILYLSSISYHARIDLSIFRAIVGDIWAGFLWYFWKLCFKSAKNSKNRSALISRSIKISYSQSKFWSKYTCWKYS